MNSIHQTAIIDPSVSIGKGNIIGPYVVITGSGDIGDDNWIGPHSTIGGPAEIRGLELPKSWESAGDIGKITIGVRNVIRESCVISAGFYTGTNIANDCYIMNQTYIAHDCTIADQVTISSQVALGGHVTILQGATLGMGTVVHQHRVIGAGCMVGMGSVVTKNVSPYSMTYGNPGKSKGGNIIGMQRAGLDEKLIQQIVEALNQSDEQSLRRIIPNEMKRFEEAKASQNV